MLKKTRSQDMAEPEGICSSWEADWRGHPIILHHAGRGERRSLTRKSSLSRASSQAWASVIRMASDTPARQVRVERMRGSIDPLRHAMPCHATLLRSYSCDVVNCWSMAPRNTSVRASTFTYRCIPSAPRLISFCYRSLCLTITIDCENPST